MTEEYNTIHDLPRFERPRERLREKGVVNLLDRELLAIIIEKGRVGKSALSLAGDLISKFGDLENLKKSSLSELQEVKGIGFATACKIKTSFELGLRIGKSNFKYNKKIDEPADVYDLFCNELGSKEEEHFILLSLNSSNKIISVDKISIGTGNAGFIHPQKIFKPPIKHSAASIIMVHNHPSGNSKPSFEDKKFTKKVKKISESLDIRFLDHIIITKEEFKTI